MDSNVLGKPGKLDERLFNPLRRDTVDGELVRPVQYRFVFEVEGGRNNRQKCVGWNKFEQLAAGTRVTAKGRDENDGVQNVSHEFECMEGQKVPDTSSVFGS